VVVICLISPREVLILKRKKCKKKKKRAGKNRKRSVGGSHKKVGKTEGREKKGVVHEDNGIKVRCGALQGAEEVQGKKNSNNHRGKRLKLRNRSQSPRGRELK